MTDTCVCCGRDIPEGRMVCLTCESIEQKPDYYIDGMPAYIKTPTNLEAYNYQMQLYAAVFGEPFQMPKPTNPLRPNTPYPSKYFDDHRFDPPKPLTGEHIKQAMRKIHANLTVCKYYKPEMDALYNLCKGLYKLPGCGAGGCLHILLDDNNYTDDDLAWCRKYCEENAKGIEHDIAMMILDEYSKLSMTERTLFDNMWTGRDIMCNDPSKCDTCELIYMEE